MKVTRVKPHQLGWLRRPELDTKTADVWELPDGSLFAQEKKKPLIIEVLKRKVKPKR
jgi:hypothetical protein